MRIRELALDLSPLRDKGPLRLVLATRVLALLCIGLTSVGVVVQVYEQTRSSTQVGAVSLVLGTGLLLGFMVGGVLADRRDRKGLILVGSTWAVVTFTALAVNSAADHPALWVVYVSGALFGFTEGVAETALTAVVPALVSENHVPATGALVTVTTTLGSIAGPMLGGVLIAGPGLAATFAIAAAGTAATTLLLTRLGPMPPTGNPGDAGAQGEPALSTCPEPGSTAPEPVTAVSVAQGRPETGEASAVGSVVPTLASGPSSSGATPAAPRNDRPQPADPAPSTPSEPGAATLRAESGMSEPQPGVLASLREGFAFIRGSRVVAAVLVVDLCAALFATPTALYPEFADERFGGGPELVGLLTTAPMIGAAVASLTSGWTGRTRRQWRVLCAAVAVWGLACLGFGLSPLLGFGLVFLGLGGVADIVSEIMRRTLLMRHTPDPLQGRVSSLWLAQAMTAPALGGVLAGLASSAVGPATAVAGGGVLCLVTLALVAVAYRGLWRDADEPVTRESTEKGLTGGSNGEATATP
ncbi:MFS transporter [Streptomyces sp. NPDC092370]|uniref:MFS transporter n=1 Tax=Streptomyces sp. NPDC092370 TaxID=3366016 RepID=UPI0038058E96